MRPLRPLGRLAALLALLALASVKPPDACKLLTLEDVTAVLGAGYTTGKAAVHGSYERQEESGRAVQAVANVCEAAYTQPGVPPNTVLVVAKRPWQSDVQVLVGRKPDVAAEQMFATTICARIT